MFVPMVTFLWLMAYGSHVSSAKSINNTKRDSRSDCSDIKVRCLDAILCEFRYSPHNNRVNPCLSNNDISGWTKVAGLGGASDYFSIPYGDMLEVAPSTWKTGYDFKVFGNGVLNCWGNLVTWLIGGRTKCQWYARGETYENPTSLGTEPLGPVGEHESTPEEQPADATRVAQPERKGPCDKKLDILKGCGLGKTALDE